MYIYCLSVFSMHYCTHLSWYDGSKLGFKEASDCNSLYLHRVSMEEAQTKKMYNIAEYQVISDVLYCHYDVQQIIYIMYVGICTLRNLINFVRVVGWVTWVCGDVCSRHFFTIRWVGGG